MGLGTWLKQALHISNSHENTAVEQQNEHREPDAIAPHGDDDAIMAAPRAGTEDAMVRQQQEISEKSAHSTGTKMRNFSEKLGKLQKGGLHHTNSAQYTAVQNAVNSVTSLMGGAFSNDIKSNHMMVVKMLEKYAVLISACNNYLDKGSPHTSAGKARYDAFQPYLSWQTMMCPEYTRS